MATRLLPHPKPHGSDGSRPSWTRNWRIVASASGILAVAYAPWFGFAALLPAIDRTMPWSTSSITLAFTTYVLTASFTAPVAGWLLAKLGPRLLQTLAAALFAVGLLTAARATELWHLYLSYGVAVGTATSCMGLTVNYAVVAKAFSIHRGLALGTASAGAHVGAAVFVPSLQHVAEASSWRIALVALGALAIVTIPALASLLPAREDRDASGLQNVVHAAHPEFMSGRGRQSFWLLFLGLATAFAAFQFVIVHQVVILVSSGYSSAVAAGAAAAVALVTVVARPLTGVALDHLGRPITFTVICVAAIGGVAMLLVVSTEAPAWTVVAFAAAFGIGYAIAGPVVPAMAADLYHSDSLGVRLGTIMLGAGLGGALGPLLGAYAYEATGSYALPLVLASVMLTTSLVAVMTMYRILGADRFTHYRPR